MQGLGAETRDAANCGFTAKACIHPSQVNPVRAAFRPTGEQLAWANRVVEAASAGGVQVIDGQMIDGPLLAQAGRIMGQSPSNP